MSLVPDKLRKAKKLVDVDKLDAFVDEGLASQESKTTARGHSPSREAPQTDAEPAGSESRQNPNRAKSPPRKSKGSKRDRPRADRSADKLDAEPSPWRDGMAKAPSVAFSVRIPTPLLERMRDVVAVVDGETLTSLLVGGAADRVSAIEASYRDQVGEPLPERKAKIEL